MEDSIVITSSDLVEHASLSRKKVEAGFRKEFLIRKGASEVDEHVSAISKQLSEIDIVLRPIEQKLKNVDIITIVPHRAEINSLSAEIAQHSKTELDEAMKTKSGPTYDLLKKRAAYTKANFESREQIARLTIILNSLPRKEAENLRVVIESGSNELVNISSLKQEQRQDIVSSMGRLGVFAYICGDTLTLDKKKSEITDVLGWDNQIEKKIMGAGNTPKSFWIKKEDEPGWEENEKKLGQVSRRIQVLITKSQADPMNPQESEEFESLQRQYIESKNMRQKLSVGGDEISVSLPRAGRA
ncbi:MAG: hypothetical protein WC492_01935 [Candidatus Micrarchaeia archaeon]